MQAVVLTRHGGPDALRSVRRPRPVPAAGERLVAVRACGVNPGLDVKTRRDGGRWGMELPRILGAEVAGVVVDDGPPGPPRGTPVLVAPLIGCGTCASCRAYGPKHCPRRQVVGVHRDGGYAELVAVPADCLVELPDGLSFAQAAGIPVGLTTAWHLAVTRTAVAPGETCVIVGATGAVGLAVAQICVDRGATVVATARSPAKAAALRAAVPGLAGVIGVGDPLPAGVGERGADVVFDLVGTATFARSLALLAPGGRLACCAGGGADELRLDLRSLYRADVTLCFGSVGTTAEIRAAAAWAAARPGRPHIGPIYPLADVADAHRAVERRDHVGKVVLTVGSDPDLDSDNERNGA